MVANQFGSFVDCFLLHALAVDFKNPVPRLEAGCRRWRLGMDISHGYSVIQPEVPRSDLSVVLFIRLFVVEPKAVVASDITAAEFSPCNQKGIRDVQQTVVPLRFQREGHFKLLLALSLGGFTRNRGCLEGGRARGNESQQEGSQKCYAARGLHLFPLESELRYKATFCLRATGPLSAPHLLL